MCCLLFVIVLCYSLLLLCSSLFVILFVVRCPLFLVVGCLLYDMLFVLCSLCCVGGSWFFVRYAFWLIFVGFLWKPRCARDESMTHRGLLVRVFWRGLKLATCSRCLLCFRPQVGRTQQADDKLHARGKSIPCLGGAAVSPHPLEWCPYLLLLVNYAAFPALFLGGCCFLHLSLCVVLCFHFFFSLWVVLFSPSGSATFLLFPCG